MARIAATSAHRASGSSGLGSGRGTRPRRVNWATVGDAWALSSGPLHTGEGSGMSGSCRKQGPRDARSKSGVASSEGLPRPW